MQGIDFIETPENVHLQRRLAGIGTRFIAGLLDSLILLGIIVALYILFRIAGLASLFGVRSGVGVWLVAVLYLLIFLVNWGYFLFFEMVMNGQTPGKRSQGIRVVKVEGNAITFTDIAIRNLIRVVDMLGVYAVAGVCMFLTKRVQRLGDLAAGTVVVIEKVEGYSARTGKRKQQQQWDVAATPEALRATNLDPKDFQILTNYWLRRSQLTLPARQKLLDTLVRPILARTGQVDPNASIGVLEHQLEALMRSAMSPADTPNEGPSQAPGKP